MRRSLRRWLLHRRVQRVQSLVLRTSWYDFAGRMRRAIALDIQFDLGELRRADLLRQQATKPLPRVDPNAPTVVQRYWMYDDATMADDPNRTQTLPEVAGIR